MPRIQKHLLIFKSATIRDFPVATLGRAASRGFLIRTKHGMNDDHSTHACESPLPLAALLCLRPGSRAGFSNLACGTPTANDRAGDDRPLKSPTRSPILPPQSDPPRGP